MKTATALAQKSYRCIVGLDKTHQTPFYKGNTSMNDILERCCGLDVHRDTIVACIMIGTDKIVKKEIKKFGTMTEDIRQLLNWLQQNDIKHVVIESTGIYWKPIFNILEGSIDIILANAAHVKNMPGRKTDVKDSEWLCMLLKKGCVKRSFIPPADIRHLRELTRYRKSSVQQLSSEKNRVIKVLESSNIKLSSVLSDVFGKSGWKIIQELAQGVLKAEILAKKMNANIKTSRKDFLKALEGTLTDSQVKLLAIMVQSIISQETHITNIEQQIREALRKYESELTLLQSIPGAGEIVVATIIAEIGTDMEQFPTEQHLASWAGLSPGNNESAGKKKSTRILPGNKNLKVALVEAAWAASKTKGTFFKATYARFKRRMGAKKSLIAIAHKILVTAYWMIKRKMSYCELGENYVTKKTLSTRTDYYKEQLVRLGFEVTLTSKPA